MDKEKITNFDVARLALNAYQAYGNKPARIEITVFNDGVIEAIFGQVNPCKFGDQCEGHACYCNNPNAYRKCHNSSYYEEKDADSKCEFFEPNPYWQDGEGDFYEQREQTLLYLKKQGLLEIEIQKIARDAPEYYRGHKSKLLEGKAAIIGYMLYRRCCNG